MVGLAIPDREARAAVGHCRHGFALFVMFLCIFTAMNGPSNNCGKVDWMHAITSLICSKSQLSLVQVDASCNSGTTAP